ncbi:MBL fold metallo-hydrolase [Benzoatithermus flavus]|uniref:MBL fold metallo-hydrolase n=1 Tax=Benzoatithermus flavus TaxID=3108223 RepID=A0ABU8XL68_9PROT
MRVTVLGCGTSAGVPQIGCTCPVCRSPDPRNKRRRCSILIEAEGQRILVDTGPDLRQQCLDAGIGQIEALLYTHAHADHVHGIDDLRAINNNMMAPIEAYADAGVFARIRERFPYVFEGGRGTHGWWRPEIRPHAFEGPFRVGEVEIVPFPQKHGRGVSWGFRIGRFAYSTDTDGLDERAFAALRGVETWIVDALRDRPHPSHAHLEMALGWIDRLAPERAFLTHMNHEVDYTDWANRLPEGVLPAHDGLVIEIPD